MQGNKPIEEPAFRILKIYTLQFAIIEGLFKENEKVITSHSLQIQAFKEENIFKFIFKAEIKQLENPFIVIEGACDFLFNKPLWNACYKVNEDSIILPKNLAIHLTGITISTVRGILHAKTENTPFNKYFIPPLLVSEFIDQDVNINFKDSEQ